MNARYREWVSAGERKASTSEEGARSEDDECGVWTAMLAGGRVEIFGIISDRGYRIVAIELNLSR